MSFFEDFRRGYRDARSDAAARHVDPGNNQPSPNNFGGGSGPAEPYGFDWNYNPSNAARHDNDAADFYVDPGNGERAANDLSSDYDYTEPPPAQSYDYDHAEPQTGFTGDELAEHKAVINGLLKEKKRLEAALAQWQAAVTERDVCIVALVAERDQAVAARDRYQANGKRALAQLKELQSIIAFPGAKNALRMALHPDTGTGGDDASRTAIVKTLNAVLARLGLG